MKSSGRGATDTRVGGGLKAVRRAAACQARFHRRRVGGGLEPLKNSFPPLILGDNGVEASNMSAGHRVFALKPALQCFIFTSELVGIDQPSLHCYRYRSRTRAVGAAPSLIDDLLDVN